MELNEDSTTEDPKEDPVTEEPKENLITKDPKEKTIINPFMHNVVKWPNIL